MRRSMDAMKLPMSLPGSLTSSRDTSPSSRYAAPSRAHARSKSEFEKLNFRKYK